MYTGLQRFQNLGIFHYQQKEIIFIQYLHHQPSYSYKILQMFKTIITKFRFSQQPLSQLSWKVKGVKGGVMIRFPISQTDNGLTYVYPTWKFIHLLASFERKFKNVDIKEIQQLETQVYDFLQNQPLPKSVTITLGSVKYVLMNKSMQFDSVQISEIVRDSKSIYGRLMQFNKKKNIQSQFDINNFIVRYYLKLHILHFMRLQNIPLNAKMQGVLKQKMVYHLMRQFDNNHKHQLRLVESQLDRVRSNMKITNKKIDQIRLKINNKIKLYRYGAIGLTLTHLTSFTYMIFFVNELGWDIIQPTTFTISVIYTLIAIRFYRKHQKDRSDENVKSSLTEIVSATTDKMRMKKYQYILQTQQSELRKYQQRKIILKDKLWYTSKMVDLF